MSSNGIVYQPADCRICDSSGKDGYSTCKICSGKGSILVAQPAVNCGTCQGTGKDSYSSCKVCDGSGYSHRLLDEENPNKYLEVIAKNTASQVTELGSVAYICGVAVSLGMNFAAGNGLGSFILCWLSWINVGYGLIPTP
jgi:hypothetical protein